MITSPSNTWGPMDALVSLFLPESSKSPLYSELMRRPCRFQAENSALFDFTMYIEITHDFPSG